MIVIRTVKLKLTVSSDSGQSLLKTMRDYTVAFNICSAWGFDNHTVSKINCHNATYQNVRQSVPNLPSSLVQGARDVACECLKAVKCQFKPLRKEYSAMRYNSRVINVFLTSGYATIATSDGRIKATFSIPGYYREYLTWKIKSSTLSLRKNDDSFYLHCQLETDTPKIISESNDTVNSLRCRFKLAMQIERIVVLAKGQGRGFNFPRQVLSVIFRDTERDLNPAISGREGCILGIQTHPDNSGVVSHCRILFTERLKLTFHRFQAFTSNISCTLHKRGREIRNGLPDILIGCIVAVNLADGVVIKTPCGADVKSHRVISHGFQERLSAIRRNVKFQLDCPNHNHILVVLEHILNGGDRCGAIPPTAKAVGFLAPRS